MKYTNTFKWLCAILNLFRRHIGVKKKKKKEIVLLYSTNRGNSSGNASTMHYNCNRNGLKIISAKTV